MIGGLYCKYFSQTFFLLILLDGSEHGKVLLTEYGCYGPVAQTLPPLVIGTVVQCINMPLVRATITIQNPTCELKTVGSALHFIYTTRGIEGSTYQKKNFNWRAVMSCVSNILETNRCMLSTRNFNLISNLLFISSGLWHGVSAGILKTVPKYVTAIVVKDFMEEHLPHGDSKDKVRNLTH